MQNPVHTDSAMRPAPTAGGQRASAQGPGAPAAAAYRGSEIASDLLRRLFRRLPMSLTLRLWNGASVRVGADAGAPDSRFALVFCNPEAVSAAVLGRDPLRLGEACICGGLRIE